MKPVQKRNPFAAGALLALAVWCLSPLANTDGLSAEARPGRIVTEYALTSAQDYSNDDPSAWRLLGSNDDGRSWTVLDVQTNQEFKERSERRVFSIRNRAAFNTYRLVIENGAEVQLAELELLGPVVGVTNEAELPAIISASAENALVAPATQAFDGDPTTKWVDFGTGEAKSHWLQCQYTLHDEVVVSNINQFLVAARRRATRNRLLDKAPEILSKLASPDQPVRPLSGYALTSANDAPERDPRDWRLLGSNDGGKTWEVLDVRRNESFARRFQRRSFLLTKPAAYALYRLEISSIRAPAGAEADSVQLAELEPLYAPGGPPGSFSLVVLAQGENPPLELAEKAFDGDVKTKWLDFGEAGIKEGGNTNRSSWIQWQYVPQLAQPVISLRWLRMARARPPRQLRLNLEGVVVSWTPATKTLALVDESGFQLFTLDCEPKDIHPGLRVRLAGQPRFDAEIPSVKDAQLDLLGALPVSSEVGIEEPLAGQQHFLISAAQGKVESISEEPGCVGMRLDAENGPGYLIAKLLNPAPGHPAIPPGCRVRVKGVVEPVFTDSGERVAGIIWVAGFEDITVLADATASSMPKPSDKTEAQKPLDSIADIRHAYEFMQKHPDSAVPVCLRGVITYIDLGLGTFYLQDGSEGILVDGLLGAGLAPFLQEEGMYVEVRGVTATNRLAIRTTAAVKMLGRGQMPEPARRSWDYLITGRDFSQWVQVEGVVREIAAHRLVLLLDGGKLSVWINEMDEKSAEHLLGSMVRVCGVCGRVVNSRNVQLGVRLLTPSLDHLEVLKAVPDNPFQLPARSIANLLPSAGRTDSRVQLVKTRGVVTYQEPRLLFVQNGENGLRVLLRNDTTVQAGDRVEVVGFAEPDGLSPKLVQALVRKTGTEPLPPAGEIDLLDTDSSSPDAVRGQIEAQLLSRSTTESHQVLELRDEKRDMTFSAFFPTNRGELPPIPLGSLLQLTGVFKAELDDLPDFGQAITSFKLYGNSPADIKILQRPSWWTASHALWVAGGLVGVLSIALAWVGSLRRQVRLRTHQLRTEAEERKQAQERLIEVSRQAGMAEVATSVLHNVGNVLNSVNVSVGLLLDRTKDSHAARLAKVAALFKAHAEDLASFLVHDSKGQKLPAYMAQLAEVIASDEAVTRTELASLGKNVEHIKEIVSMQQSLARHVGVMENVPVAELVEDALQLNAGTLARHHVTVQRVYPPHLPTLAIDKHKVLQILINLIRNAECACDESGRPDKTLTVSIANGGGSLRISVADNGVGIAQENLTRIFSFGFSTRKNGHGFGLHSGALAAKELGGALTVHSEGPGRGATFTLELPVNSSN